MRPSFSLFALVLAVALAACSSDATSIIIKTDPLNGATAIDPRVKPEIQLGEGIRIVTSFEKPQVALYDITGTTRVRVGGTLDQDGTKLTYTPVGDLTRNHDYELEIVRAAIEGDKIEDIDASEWPEELLTTAPYRLCFSTRSAPQVRAAYLEVDGAIGRLHLRFSQKMDPRGADGNISMADEFNKVIKLSKPIWSAGDVGARIEVLTAMKAASVYTLRIKRDTRAADGAALDGNFDGKLSSSGDDFSVQFTGSQRIVRSRLCPKKD